MHVIDLNLHLNPDEFFKRLYSTDALSELNELNAVYLKRTIAMQKVWINDYVAMQNNMLASMMGMGSRQTLSTNLQQNYTAQLKEYSELVENALESYSLWFLNQASKSR